MIPPMVDSDGVCGEQAKCIGNIRIRTVDNPTRCSHLDRHTILVSTVYSTYKTEIFLWISTWDVCCCCCYSSFLPSFSISQCQPFDDFFLLTLNDFDYFVRKRKTNRKRKRKERKAKIIKTNMFHISHNAVRMDVCLCTMYMLLLKYNLYAFLFGSSFSPFRFTFTLNSTQLNTFCVLLIFRSFFPFSAGKMWT